MSDRAAGPQRGFTLIELAIVLAIVGIMTGGAMMGLSALRENTKLKETHIALRDVEHALTLFVIRNGRLPWADSNQDGTEDANQAEGTVPYTDLGLGEGEVIDGWGNYLRYRVDGALSAAAALPCTGAQTGFPAAGGGINLIDQTITAMPVAYAIVSHGTNGLGAINSNGVLNDLAVSTNELANTNGDTDFRSEGQAADGFYDDIVTGRTASQILRDGGCRLVSHLKGIPPTDDDCIPVSVFSNGLSATGDGGITLSGNPDLNNLPSDVLTGSTLDKPNWSKYTDYSASGSPGEKLDVPTAPANSSTDDYVAGQWPDVDRTLDASHDFRSLEIRSNGSLTLNSDGSMVLNVANDFEIKQGHLIVNGDVTIYADDFPIGGSSSITVNNGLLTIILSGDFSVSGSASVNASGTPGNVLVLAAGATTVGGSGRVKGYVYSGGDVDLSGSASVTGSVAGDGVTMSGSASVTYSADAPSSLSDDC